MHCNPNLYAWLRGLGTHKTVVGEISLALSPSVKMKCLIWFLFVISLIYKVHGEELCGLEPPKAGEASCGGVDGVEATEEDR